MTIDATDYEPRPADDYLSEYFPRQKYPVKDEDFPRFYSLIEGWKEQLPCHQLGCNFNELPHA